MAAKLFEVGDVLPATTQLKVTWQINSVTANRSGYIITTNSYLFIYFDIEEGYFEDGYIKVNNQIVTYLSIPGPYEIIIDTSSWNLARRTVTDDTTNDVMLFYWEDLNAPQGYTITFNSNGGSSVSDIEEATELPTPLPTTTKAGYKFVNWYYESNFQTRANANDTIESNVTLYAKWHNLGSLFTEIANAIREKESSSGTIRDIDFGERVKQIQGAKPEQQKIVTSSTSTQDVLPDSGKVLSRVTVNAIPTETKTVTPNFSSGNVVVTPTSGKVITQVTINKDSNLIANNIKKDVTVHGITGTAFIAIELTQAQYDALTTKDSNTYYLIVEE